jgi:hypothetical protein
MRPVSLFINGTFILFGMIGAPLIASLGMGPFRIASPEAWTHLVIGTATAGLLMNSLILLKVKKKSQKKDFLQWSIIWGSILTLATISLNHQDWVKPFRLFFQSLRP